MDLVQRDGDRVTKKLDSVPPDERKLLERRGVTTPKVGAAGFKADEPLIPSLLAGLVHGVIVMMSFGSFAIVIFGQSEHAELRDALNIAISQQVLSACVLIGILTFTGFFPFTMGGPTPPAALLMADVVRSVVGNVSDPEKKVPTALLTIALVTLLMGLMLVAISATKTTVYALQLPFPVLCGFLGSVGVLLMRNSFGILLNLKLKWFFIPADWDKAAKLDPVGAACQLVLGVTVALILLQGVPRIRGKLSKKAGLTVLPILFLLPLVAFYCAVLAGGLDMGLDSELRTMNPPWLSKASAWTWAPKEFFVTMYDVTRWDVAALLTAESIMRMFISAFLCVIAALINMAGIETNAPQKNSLDLDKEFMSLGRANLVVGLLGGHPGHHVAAFTLPMKKDGGTRRAAPWTASLLWFGVFLSAAPIGAIIPRFFFGGCFLQVGFGLARTFLWDNRGGLDRASICISLLTVVTAIFTDLNIACGVGFMLVAVNFVRLSMNVDVVRAVERADMRRAPKYRSQKEVDYLALYGHKVMVLYLEGYLFWGTVDEITGAFEELIDGTDDDPETIFVDLRYVAGIELSVINTFKKLARLAGNVGIKIKLCSLPSEDVVGPGLYKLLASLPFACKDDLCSLMEQCEDELLATFMPADDEAPEVKNLLIRRTADGQIPDERAYWRGATFRGWKAWLNSAKEEARLRRSNAKQAMLSRLVEATGSTYGLFWDNIGDDLVVTTVQYATFRAQTMVEVALRDQSEVRTYAMASMRTSYCLGDLEAMDGEGLAVRITTPETTTGSIDSRAQMSEHPYKQGPELHGKCNLPWTCLASERTQTETASELQETKPIDFVRLSTSEQLEEGIRSTDPLINAWLSQKAILCHDVAKLPGFKRRDLASDFDICKCIFVPTSQGVVELGVARSRSRSKELNALQSIVPITVSEDPATLLSAPERLCSHFKVDRPSLLQVSPAAAALSKRISFNLLIAISAMGETRRCSSENPILEEPSKNAHIISTAEEAAETIYVVYQGTFGTFRKRQLAEDGDAMDLVIKSPPGTILGADDVWGNRPRSVQLQCLTQTGQVVALSRMAVKAIETCDSPLLAERETQEFIDFMKREMSLNMSIIMSTFCNPQK